MIAVVVVVIYVLQAKQKHQQPNPLCITYTLLKINHQYTLVLLRSVNGYVVVGDILYVAK